MTTTTTDLEAVLRAFCQDPEDTLTAMALRDAALEAGDLGLAAACELIIQGDAAIIRDDRSGLSWDADLWFLDTALRPGHDLQAVTTAQTLLRPGAMVDTGPTGQRYYKTLWRLCRGDLTRAAGIRRRYASGKNREHFEAGVQKMLGRLADACRP